jgi:hypothetical protein
MAPNLSASQHAQIRVILLLFLPGRVMWMNPAAIKRIGFRRTGCVSAGRDPCTNYQIFHRGQLAAPNPTRLLTGWHLPTRVHFTAHLTALCLKTLLLNSSFHHCGRYPEPVIPCWLWIMQFSRRAVCGKPCMNGAPREFATAGVIRPTQFIHEPFQPVSLFPALSMRGHCGPNV